MTRNERSFSTARHAPEQPPPNRCVHDGSGGCGCGSPTLGHGGSAWRRALTVVASLTAGFGAERSSSPRSVLDAAGERPDSVLFPVLYGRLPASLRTSGHHWPQEGADALHDLREAGGRLQPRRRQDTILKSYSAKKNMPSYTHFLRALKDGIPVWSGLLTLSHLSSTSNGTPAGPLKHGVFQG